MIASDDEQRAWEGTSSNALRFAGMAGLRPLVASVCAGSLFIAAAFGVTLAPSGMVVAALVIAGLFWRSAPQLLVSSTSKLWGSPSPIGSFVVARALLAVGAGVAVGHSGVVSETWIACTVAVILGLLGVELSLRTFLDRCVPVSRNLPGVGVRDRLKASPVWVFVLSVASTVLLAVGAFSELVFFLAVAAAVVSAAVTSLLFADTALLIRSRQGAGTKLRAALTAYEPAFVLHWQAPKNTQYQVGMWLPHLEETGANFYVLLRSAENFDEVAALTSRPIVLRESLRSLDDVVVPSLKAALYVNTATVNNHFVRFRQMTHIQLNHGDSDKAPSFNPAFRVFDRNFVAGQAAVDRFAANGVSTAPDFFEIVGRPQTSGITGPALPLAQVERPTVLYAPTWHGFYNDTNYTSLDFAELIVAELLKRGTRVIFRPHPYSLNDSRYRGICDRVNGLLEQDATGHVFGAEASDALLFDLFNQSDLLISDVSSVVSDYLASSKPIVLINRAANSAPAGSLTRACYVVDASESLDVDAFGVLLGNLVADDRLVQQRAEAREYLLGPSADPESDLFQSVLRNYLK